MGLETVIAAQAIGAITSLAGGMQQAGAQRELAGRNARAVLLANRSNETRQKRVDQAIQARARSRVVSAGFTTRGSPLEALADLAAEQEENKLLRDFEARTTAEDIRIRGEFAARRSEAQGISGFIGGIGDVAGSTVNFFEPGT
jgi:hypothetical protein